MAKQTVSCNRSVGRTAVMTRRIDTEGGRTVSGGERNANTEDHLGRRLETTMTSIIAAMSAYRRLDHELSGQIAGLAANGSKSAEAAEQIDNFAAGVKARRLRS